MPITQYTDAQRTILEAFEIPENFKANSFSFYNAKTNTTIEDAISTDSQGNLIFKDADVKLYLKDLVTKAQNITEEIDLDGDSILFFRDRNNRKYSLGEIYKNLFLSEKQNYVYWFHERASRNLDFGMDQYILDEISGTAVNDINVFDVNDEYYNVDELWKNKWIDIPCMEVITPEYVNGKAASISALVHFKMKTDKPIVTGFRIYDATAGIELQRVIHTSNRDPGKFVSYSVPLHYQGPLPDTEVISDSLNALDVRDVNNIQYDGGRDEAQNVVENPNRYDLIPSTRHVIKLQWITCDLAVYLDNNGRKIFDYDRLFDPTATSSLDVTLYNRNLAEGDVSVLSGVIDTREFEDKNQTTYTHTFDIIPFGLGSEYSVTTGANKNVKINLIERNANEFTIQWERPIDNLTIDWKILYKVALEDVDELKDLTNPDRVTNYNLFPNREFSTDFCDELINIETIEVGEEPPEPPPPPPPQPPEPPPPFSDCECCECCDSVDLNIVFEHVTLNSTEPPDCLFEPEDPEEPWPVFYDFVTDSNNVTLFGENGTEWALKASLENPSSDPACRTGIMNQTMYDNYIAGNITNPILPQQLIVEPGEKVFVVNIPVEECDPQSETATEDVNVLTWPL